MQFFVSSHKGGVKPADWIDIFYRAVELYDANATHFAFLSSGYSKGTEVRLSTTRQLMVTRNTF